MDDLNKFAGDIENNWNDDEDYDRGVLTPDAIEATVDALIENVILFFHFHTRNAFLEVGMSHSSILIN